MHGRFTNWPQNVCLPFYDRYTGAPSAIADPTHNSLNHRDSAACAISFVYLQPFICSAAVGVYAVCVSMRVANNEIKKKVGKWSGRKRTERKPISISYSSMALECDATLFMTHTHRLMLSVQTATYSRHHALSVRIVCVMELRYWRSDIVRLNGRHVANCARYAHWRVDPNHTPHIYFTQMRNGTNCKQKSEKNEMKCNINGVARWAVMETRCTWVAQSKCERMRKQAMWTNVCAMCSRSSPHTQLKSKLNIGNWQHPRSKSKRFHM